ncbi:hypothetical protein [Thermorudis peleae]|uniref:hypothetical protein n=1 Tax=Thermorudis peleae TaxID=1382356 RepID=UPI00057062F5|nr:hypothetical protein [Thermorudis peleae]MBX6752703.1 hypothetical protein [Thermorudis peleae]
MQFGTFLLMLALSYAFGVLWYDLLPGKLSMKPWRVAAYPFLGMWVAEVFFHRGPAFGDLHLIPLVIGSLVAVIIDWIITAARHPASVPDYEARATAA